MKRTLGLLFGAALMGGALLGCAPVLTIGEVCGDGEPAGGEACDDGNTAAGDGCDAACAVETGYTCSGAPSACAPLCSDGLRLGAEECDGADLGGIDCLTVPGETYRGGTLACNADCTFNTLACDPVEDCNNGGDEDEDNIYDCADAECVDRPPCNTGNETVCDDAVDQDSDGLLDCSDPSDCQSLAMCTPGAGPVGDPCVLPGDCAANGNDPFCIDEADFPTWLGGYCSEFCDLAAPDCPSGSTCFDSGLAGVGLCLELCTDTADCRPNYTCNQFGARQICWPGTEICDNLIDDENDGDIDCEDLQCDTFAACAQCGDGTVSQGEQCDDNNATAGDGCSDTCQLEGGTEAEPNSICSQPDGPITPGSVVTGVVGDMTDYSDIYAISIPPSADPADITIHVYTQGGCDAPFYFYGKDCGNFLQFSCDELSSTFYGGLQRMGQGLYFIEIMGWNGVATPYTLQVTYDAQCGNNLIEGSEECDGGADCTAACKPVSTCGDGTVEGNEQCDDGNLTPGDGCDQICLLEVQPEQESNNTCMFPNGPLSPDFIMSGAIEASGAEDWFAIGLTEMADLRIETFGAAGPGSCDGDTMIELYGGDCMTQLAQNDDFYNVCSLIDAAQFPAVHDLPPDIYYVKVRGFSSSTPPYRLQVTTNTCGDGTKGGTEECDAGPNGDAGCTAGCKLITTCGDNVVEGNEQCDPPDIVTCGLTCKVVYPPESQCNDLWDEDSDGLTDCEDPGDCKLLPDCTPGNTAPGGPCMSPSECQANNTDPICFSFFGPDGYCSEFCDLAADDCPAGSICVNYWGFPSGAGTCMQSCMTDMDCRPGYYCYGNFCGF